MFVLIPVPLREASNIQDDRFASFFKYDNNFELIIAGGLTLYSMASLQCEVNNQHIDIINLSLAK